MKAAKASIKKGNSKFMPSAGFGMIGKVGGGSLNMVKGGFGFMNKGKNKNDSS